MKIAVIGYGYVGKAVYELLKDHYEVLIYDPAYEKSNTKEEIRACAAAFVCVPTPDIEGKCDTSVVEEVVGWLDVPLIIIKSTVKPGTTDKLRRKYGKRIVFSPEYAGENKYWVPYKFMKEMKECPFLIAGGPSDDTSAFIDLMVPILGPKKFYYQVSAKEAEVIKYMENSYIGLKVIFANEMKRICEALLVNYYKVREGWALDPRVDPMHSIVFPEAKGYSGKCIPKDINGIISSCQEAGYEPELLKEIVKSNERFRNNAGKK